MFDIGTLGNTDKLTITSTASAFQATVPTSRYVFFSDRNGHIHHSTSDGDVATVNDLRFPADQLVAVNVQPGDWISFILATGETDGHVYVAEASI